MTRIQILAGLLLFAWSAVAQKPTLLILNKQGSVAIVDPLTDKVLGTAPTGEAPHEVIASNDGKLAIASNYGTAQTPGHSLSVIDLASRKEIHRVDVSPLIRPHGLYAAGGKIYFTAEGSKKIARYDPATNHVDWELSTGQDGTHMVSMSKDHSLIFTSNIGSGSISIFAQAGNEWHPTVVSVGRGAEGFDISPDGKQLWAANAGDATVSVIDIPSKKVIATFPVSSKRTNRLKFTPDGKRALLSDITTGDLVILDVATRKEIKRLNLGHAIAGILVQPDGARAYVAATPDNYVAIVDLKTLEPAGRISTGKGPDGMDWIP
jgi:YVTN family beta-propeller protein